MTDVRPRSSAVTDAIVSCERCPRLRTYCQQVARDKKAAHRDDVYWGRPVPGFGDPRARVLILGLAPAAHGANRTGRVFTGDGVGASGDFLMAALHRAGFANIATSQHVDDGLRLTRCVHRRGGPLRAAGQQAAARRGRGLRRHLDAEVAALPRLQVVVALGKIAWDAWLQHLARRRHRRSGRARVRHGAVVPSAPAHPRHLRHPGTLGTAP